MQGSFSIAGKLLEKHNRESDFLVYCSLEEVFIMKKKCVLNQAMQEGLLLLLLGGWLLWYSIDAYQHSYIKDWLQSPSLFPVIVSCVLGLLGVIVFSQGLMTKEEAKGKAGNWLETEIITIHPEKVGVAVNNKTGAEADTTVFKIHYGKRGTHVVPDYPSKKGAKNRK